MICNDLATLCVNLVNFRPVTLQFKRVVSTPLIFKKKSFETNNLRIYLANFTTFSPCGRYLIVDYGSYLSFPIAQGSRDVAMATNHF